MLTFLGSWGFYAIGAFVIFFIVPLVVLFTRAEDGKPRLSPETRSTILMLYVGVLGLMIGLIALIRLAMF